MDNKYQTFPSPMMDDREKERLIWALHAPFVKPRCLPRWIPVFIRQLINGFERIHEPTFAYYCKWAAWEQYDDASEWLLIAAKAALYAHANGDSRLWLVWRWANTPSYDDSWMD